MTTPQAMLVACLLVFAACCLFQYGARVCGGGSENHDYVMGEPLMMPPMSSRRLYSSRDYEVLS
jgi:hypothetical protein